MENNANSQAADEVALWSEALRLVNEALSRSGNFWRVALADISFPLENVIGMQTSCQNPGFASTV